MTMLFTPLTIKDITFRNRIAVSPMCMYSAVDGYANDFHLVHQGSRALGGAGLIIQEATAVLPEGRITPGDLGMWDDRHMEMPRRINSFLHEQGAVAGIQLAHAGRKAGCARPWEGGLQLKGVGWKHMAPSPIGFYPDDEVPEALDGDGIARVVDAFRNSAGRAHDAGYRVLEIHAAHGYLLHEFLSPLSNTRTDEYGGSFMNRIRLLLEVVKSVRGVWPERLPFFVRLSATDWVEGGWNPDETVALASILKSEGVDLIDCSSGGLVPGVKIPTGPGFQVPFAERIKKEADIATGAVGFILTGEQAEQVLEKEQADLILIGRESLRDPNFPLHAAGDLGEPMEWPAQYRRGDRERLA